MISKILLCLAGLTALVSSGVVPTAYTGGVVPTAYTGGVVPTAYTGGVLSPYAAFPAPYVAQSVAAPVAAPLAVAPYAKVIQPEPADAHPQYAYAYQVQDTLTGDSKAQEEVREGGVVKGSYTLLEPDGTRRTVNYYADPINGFNAVVHRGLPAVAAVVA